MPPSSSPTQAVVWAQVLLVRGCSPFDRLALVPVREYQPQRPALYYWELAKHDERNNALSLRSCAPATGDIVDRHSRSLANLGASSPLPTIVMLLAATHSLM